MSFQSNNYLLIERIKDVNRYFGWCHAFLVMRLNRIHYNPFPPLPFNVPAWYASIDAKYQEIFRENAELAKEVGFRINNKEWKGLDEPILASDSTSDPLNSRPASGPSAENQARNTNQGSTDEAFALMPGFAEAVTQEQIATREILRDIFPQAAPAPTSPISLTAEKLAKICKFRSSPVYVWIDQITKVFLVRKDPLTLVPHSEFKALSAPQKLCASKEVFAADLKVAVVYLWAVLEGGIRFKDLSIARGEIVKECVFEWEQTRREGRRVGLNCGWESSFMEEERVLEENEVGEKGEDNEVDGVEELIREYPYWKHDGWEEAGIKRWMFELFGLEWTWESEVEEKEKEKSSKKSPRGKRLKGVQKRSPHSARLAAQAKRNV